MTRVMILFNKTTVVKDVPSNLMIRTKIDMSLFMPLGTISRQNNVSIIAYQFD